MLKLLVRNNDICRISKLLGKNKLKAYITSSTIIIDNAEIAEDVINQLCENIDIIAAQNYQEEDNIQIQNYQDDEITNVENQIEKEDENLFDYPYEVEHEDQNNQEILESEQQNQIEYFGEKPIRYLKKQDVEEVDEEVILSEFYEMFGIAKETGEILDESNKKSKSNKIPEEELLYRGEVYSWGKFRKDEEVDGKKVKEFVIILQNDYQKSASNDTIALLCTSQYSSRSPFHFYLCLGKDNMVDYYLSRLGPYAERSMFVSRIICVERNKLGRYLGTLNASFMSTLQPSIDFCLGIKSHRDLNVDQVKILSTINVQELLDISESNLKYSQKVKEILKLFKFDMTQNGVLYIKKAILVASTKEKYMLEDLVKVVAKSEHLEEAEILRLIVARIKEKFHFRKSPAISFIRLIDTILKKG